MTKGWWKIPLYCLVASWIGYFVRIRLLAVFMVTKLADGTSVLEWDSILSIVISAVLFLVIVCIGGFLLCRKMTRKEIFVSSTVLVVLNIVLTLATYFAQKLFPGAAATTAAVYWAELSAWDVVFPDLLSLLGVNFWVSQVLTWILPPYVFVLFGKKSAS